MISPPVMDSAAVQALSMAPYTQVDLRRDIYHFVLYVRAKGLVRTVRNNGISKPAGRALARVLSFAGEAEAVENFGEGWWSNRISYLARGLGLVAFDTKGTYLGYSSSERSFPNNPVLVDEAAWGRWLGLSALQKERAILEYYNVNAGNEFVYSVFATSDRFVGSGMGTGPVAAMKLPVIRRTLLQWLAELEPMQWYDFEDLVALLQARFPNLILGAATREPTWESKQRLAQWHQDRTVRRVGRPAAPTAPEIEYQNFYANFREFAVTAAGRNYGRGTEITEETPQRFRRVEGRYLQFFLESTLTLMRFVDLAWRPGSDPTGLDVEPSLGRLRAVRILPRLRQVLSGDAALNRLRVTVLPDFQVLVEAPSYPDGVLDALAPFTRIEKDEAPVWTLRIERDLVVKAAAQPGSLPAAGVLERWSGTPLPPNVATELASWTRRGEKITIYKDFSLVELLDSAQRADIVAALGVQDEADMPAGFLLVPAAADAYEVLLQAWHVPSAVTHPAEGFGARPGRWTPAVPRPAVPAAPPRPKVSYQVQDAVILRASDPALLKALGAGGIPGLLVLDGGLVLPAASLPQLRKVIAALGGRFDLEEVQPGMLPEAPARAPQPAQKKGRQSRSSTR